MNKIMNGIEVSSYYEKILKNEINNLKGKLQLVVIQVSDDEASNIYVGKKRNICNNMGITFTHLKYDHIEEEELIKKIGELNDDSNVTGILVQFPLPDYLDEVKIINAISYKKDVDGLTRENYGNLYTSNKSIIPCTSLGVIKLLDYYKVALASKNVVLVGSSKLVGLSLIKLLIDRKSTVSVCNIYTEDISFFTKQADIIISSTGKKWLIKKNMIKKNSILVDVGIVREENIIYGDIDPSCIKKCSMMTNTPGGTGPMTVIMLINNLLECYKMQN